MSMLSDVSVKSLAASGSVIGSRTRVKGLVVTPGTSAGSVVLKDGGASGTTVLTIVTIANGQSFSVHIPGNGVLFDTDAYATLSNASVTVFYG
jgi:hypothetical protein